MVTDSNAMLPASLRDRFGIAVVPLTVVVDGQAHHETDLDASWFCARLRAGAEVSTAAPAPGQLLAAYEAAATAGADAVLSVHVGANQSATVAAAGAAAGMTDVPVRIVDTGTASFIEGCCVWRAAEALAGGADVEAAGAAAARTASSAASVFTIGEIARANDGGRLPVAAGEGVPVYCSAGPDMRELARVGDVDAAAAAMAAAVAEAEGPLRVGVGDADAPEAADALEAVLRALPQVAEVVRYLVGPSVAAHTGAGTFGAVFHPLDGGA